MTRRVCVLMVLMAMMLAVAQGASPVVTSYAPALVASAGDTQTVTLTGTGFSAGMTGLLTDPAGKTSAVPAGRFVVKSATAATVRLRFSSVGTYQLKVVTAGGTSAVLSLPVTDAPKPMVSSSLPGALSAAKTAQWVTFYGSGLRPGLTVTLTTPAVTGSVVYGGFSIRNVTANSFEAELPLPREGVYSLTVNDPDDARSKPYPFTVGLRPTTPVVTGVSGALGASRHLQVVTVSGRQFLSGARVTLTLPDGGHYAGSTSLVLSQGETALEVFVPLATEGSYQLVVFNPDGGRSEPFRFAVGSGVPEPEITSVVPSQVVVADGPQRIAVKGKNLPGALVLLVVEPHGSEVVLSGERILHPSEDGFEVDLGFQEPGTYLLEMRTATGSSGPLAVAAVSGLGGPMLTGYRPETLSAAASAQDVVLTGWNFDLFTRAVLAAPDGTGATALGVKALNSSGTELTVSATLPNQGNYLAQVTNTNGVKSNWLTLRVGGSVSQQPVITSVEPFALAAGAELRTVVLKGVNFSMSGYVVETLPDTTQILYTQQEFLESTPFRTMIRTAFPQAGDYQFQMVTPEGGWSAPFVVSVAAAAGTPVITSHTPAAVQASPASQSLSIAGSGFQDGLKVTVVGPDATLTVVSGEAIRTVSATGFVMTSVWPAAGNYQLQVENPDGSAAAPYTVVVSDALSHPAITGCSYAWVQYDGSVRPLKLSGKDFRPGAVVQVDLPAKFSQAFSGSYVQFLDTANLWVLSSLIESGTYQISVTNPDGQRSAVYSCRVGQ